MDKHRAGPNINTADAPAKQGHATRIASIGQLLARIEKTADGFGHWRRDPRHTLGHPGIPWVEFSAEARNFLAMLRDARLIIPSFDWVAWDRRGRYMDNPATVADASFDDCRKLLTALVRGDRFNEGLLLEAFDSGLLRRLIDRMAALVGA